MKIKEWLAIVSRDRNHGECGDLFPRLELNNGKSVSVQASARHFCTPKATLNNGNYISVEVYDPDCVLMDYISDDNYGTYFYVDITYLQKRIDACGGLKSVRKENA